MNEEIKKLIEEFEIRLQEVKDKYNELEYGFKKGEPYWFIASNGEPQSYKLEDDISTFEKMIASIGNRFKTKEDALFAVEQLKVLHELQMLGRPFERGEANWAFTLDSRDDFEFDYSRFQRTTYINCYFNNRDEIKEAVLQIGESRIKKYLFGIKDE